MRYTSEQRRRAYLDALGIELFVPREATGEIDAVEVSQADSERFDSSVDVPEAEVDFAALRERVATCTRCALHKTRTQAVFGVGDPAAELMVIGEAPGAEEDRKGEPFVGRAGKLLDEMLRAIGEAREKVFIANVLKCRPPNNRDPARDEAESCREYLDAQISYIAPRLILVVGRIAAQELLSTDAPVGRLRGRQHDYKGIPLVVTYHPAYLLRSPAQKARAWDDLRLAIRCRKEPVQ